MKHLLSILILLGFISVASGLNIPEYNEKDCVTAGFYWHGDNVCRSSKIDLSDIGSGIDLGDSKLVCEYGYSSVGVYPNIRCEPDNNVIEDIQEVWSERTPTQKENLNILIILVLFGGGIAFLIINKSVKKTKEVYKSSTLPLKNKVKRKELETRFNELDEVKPAEHTYKKTAYVDDTEEINEVKKLERQIKIKKLQKELKDLEEE